MLGLNNRHRYFVYSHPTDMRKSFNGLTGLVRNQLDRNPLCGDVFVFLNKRRTLIKLLRWDYSGYVIYYKRLEQGTFEHPQSNEQSIQIKWEELVMILEGIELSSIVKSKRYKRAE